MEKRGLIAMIIAIIVLVIIISIVLVYFPNLTGNVISSGSNDTISRSVIWNGNNANVILIVNSSSYSIGISETIPEGCNVSEASKQGIIKNSSIDWLFAPAKNSKVLGYKISCTNNNVDFSGEWYTIENEGNITNGEHSELAYDTSFYDSTNISIERFANQTMQINRSYEVRLRINASTYALVISEIIPEGWEVTAVSEQGIIQSYGIDWLFAPGESKDIGYDIIPQNYNNSFSGQWYSIEDEGNITGIENVGVIPYHEEIITQPASPSTPAVSSSSGGGGGSSGGGSAISSGGGGSAIIKKSVDKTTAPVKSSSSSVVNLNNPAATGEEKGFFVKLIEFIINLFKR